MWKFRSLQLICHITSHHKLEHALISFPHAPFKHASNRALVNLSFKMESTTDGKHVQVRFLTKQEKYAVSDSPFSVPSQSDVEQLNLLINALLKESKDDISESLEFDFLVGGILLRHNLSQHVENNSISTENVVDIEYLLKYPSPTPLDSLLHNDWVSAVDATDKWILTGCYDCTLHIWSFDGEHKLTIPGHTGPVKDVLWLKSDYPLRTFVSTSHDQTAMIWQWNEATNSVECISICKGHSRSVDCVASNHDGTKFVTGSWDKMIKIWLTNPDSEVDGDHEERKRLKVDTGKSTIYKTPVMTLSGHREAVSGVAWLSDGDVCTSSWDHTIRIWDTELGGIKSELVGSKNFLGISYSSLSHLLVSASSDRHIRLWDPRSNEGSVVKSVYTSHTGWVTCVAWSAVSEYQFMSGSHDALVKLWDSRSPSAPLYDLSGHMEKILCCSWSNPKYMLSGGADDHLKIFQASPDPNLKT